MQYDFNLAANTSTTIEVAGRFFKYKIGTGLIRVRTSKGGFVDLLPGQGVWNTDYTSLTIADKTGLQNAGVILAGDFDFHDDRITGTVDVVDGGKARTLANLAYSGAVHCAATAGNYSTCQIFNPIGSAKNMYVSKVIVTTDTAGLLRMGYNNIANGPLQGQISSKKTGGASSTVQQVAIPIAAIPTGFQYLSLFSTQVGSAFIYQFAEPVLIVPGYGINVQHSVLATGTLDCTFEFIEESI